MYNKPNKLWDQEDLKLTEEMSKIFDKIFVEFKKTVSRNLPTILEENIKKAITYNLFTLQSVDNHFSTTTSLDFSGIFLVIGSINPSRLNSQGNINPYSELPFDGNVLMKIFFKYINKEMWLKSVESIDISYNRGLTHDKYLKKLPNLKSINLSESDIIIQPSMYEDWLKSGVDSFDKKYLDKWKIKNYKLYKSTFSQIVTIFSKYKSLEDIVFDIEDIYEISPICLFISACESIKKMSFFNDDGRMLKLRINGHEFKMKSNSELANYTDKNKSSIQYAKDKLEKLCIKLKGTNDYSIIKDFILKMPKDCGELYLKLKKLNNENPTYNTDINEILLDIKEKNLTNLKTSRQKSARTIYGSN